MFCNRSKNDPAESFNYQTPSNFMDLHLATGHLATTRRFLTYIRTYQKLFKEKTMMITKNQKKLEVCNNIISSQYSTFIIAYCF